MSSLRTLWQPPVDWPNTASPPLWMSGMYAYTWVSIIHPIERHSSMFCLSVCLSLPEHSWNLWIPGFGVDERSRPTSSTSTEAHRQVRYQLSSLVIAITRCSSSSDLLPSRRLRSDHNYQRIHLSPSTDSITLSVNTSCPMMCTLTLSINIPAC